MIPELGQTIRYENIYGVVHKILDDNYYLIEMGMSMSAPCWFKKLHISEFKPTQWDTEWDVG